MHLPAGGGFVPGQRKSDLAASVRGGRNVRIGYTGGRKKKGCRGFYHGHKVDETIVVKDVNAYNKAPGIVDQSDIETLMFLTRTERSNSMVSAMDKVIYFPKSFNEQMSWLGEEVERLIKNNDKYKIKKRIQEQGRAAYGVNEYTRVINRLFGIIKSDPKNKGVFREVCRAEQELIAFLYDEPEALPEAEIFAYWNDYLQSYIAEFEAHPVHYVLVKGRDASHAGEDKKDEILGIYDNVKKLQNAYMTALTVNHEKVMINAFDEVAGCWHYDVEPEQLFGRQRANGDHFKMIECVIDSADMCMFKLDKLKKSLVGYAYEDVASGSRRNGTETLTVRFEVEHSYQVLGLFDCYWGGWNAVPDARIMQEKAKEWYEKYDAEIVRISHDTLAFRCRKLSENEADSLMNDAEKLYAEIIDCKPEELREHLMEKETFTLWWD